MEDAQGQRRVIDEPDGPEVCMKDVDDQPSVQDDVDSPEFHREGARNARQATRRKSLWQWNRIHKGGPHNPRRIEFSGSEGIQITPPTNATAEDFFKLDIHAGIIDYLVRVTNLYA